MKQVERSGAPAGLRLREALLDTPIARSKRVADQVYRHLRRAILAGQIAPGSRLREVDVASALHVSRTPVREAISRLLGDWLVRELPTNGVEVVDIKSEVADIFYIREALELCAVRLAARRITPEQLKALDQLTKSAKTATFNERVRINKEFHLAIAKASGSRRLLEMIQDFREYYLTPRWVTRRDTKVIDRALRDHRAIVSALRARSADRSERVLRQHLKLGFMSAVSDPEK